MAHVRAVRQVVGAIGADEQLVEECRFVRGAARGVENRFIGRGERVQGFGDPRECRVPADRHVAVAGGVIGHGLGQPALGFEELVGLLRQPGDAVFGEERCGDPLRSGFVGDRLDPVLAEFEGRMRVAVGPGAARAVEAGRLVGAQQCAGAAQHRILLAQRLPGGFQGIPAAGGLVVVPDRGVIIAVFGHPGILTQRISMRAGAAGRRECRQRRFTVWPCPGGREPSASAVPIHGDEALSPARQVSPAGPVPCSVPHASRLRPSPRCQKQTPLVRRHRQP